MTLITYQHRAVAIADVDHVHLAPHIDRLPDGHALKTLCCSSHSVPATSRSASSAVTHGATRPPAANGMPREALIPCS